MTNNEFAAGLRAVADFYEQHPEMAQPYAGLFAHLSDRQQFINAAVTLADGGKVNKSATDGAYPEYRCDRDFSGVRVILQIPRNVVCRLVKPAVYDCPDSLLEAAAEYAAPEATV